MNLGLWRPACICGLRDVGEPGRYAWHANVPCQRGFNSDSNLWYSRFECYGLLQQKWGCDKGFQCISRLVHHANPFHRGCKVVWTAPGRSASRYRLQSTLSDKHWGRLAMASAVVCVASHLHSSAVVWIKDGRYRLQYRTSAFLLSLLNRRQGSDMQSICRNYP